MTTETDTLPLIRTKLQCPRLPLVVASLTCYQEPPSGLRLTFPHVGTRARSTKLPLQGRATVQTQDTLPSNHRHLTN